MEQVERGQVDAHRAQAVLFLVLEVLEESLEVVLVEVLLLPDKLLEGLPVLLLRLGVLLLVERHLLGLRETVDIKILEIGQDSWKVVGEASSSEIIVASNESRADVEECVLGQAPLLPEHVKVGDEVGLLEVLLFLHMILELFPSRCFRSIPFGQSSVRFVNVLDADVHAGSGGGRDGRRRHHSRFLVHGSSRSILAFQKHPSRLNGGRGCRSRSIVDVHINVVASIDPTRIVVVMVNIL